MEVAKVNFRRGGFKYATLTTGDSIKDAVLKGKYNKGVQIGDSVTTVGAIESIETVTIDNSDVPGYILKNSSRELDTGKSWQDLPTKTVFYKYEDGWGEASVLKPIDGLRVILDKQGQTYWTGKTHYRTVDGHEELLTTIKQIPNLVKMVPDEDSPSSPNYAAKVLKYGISQW